MMSRVFSVHQDTSIETYKGFNKDFQPSNLNLVAIVIVEGEPELFALDDTKEARNELVRFLAEQDQYKDYATIVGIYMRGK